MVYNYIYKHNFILGGMCYYTKARLHVSAFKVDHLQVAHENISIGYSNVSGWFIGCGEEGEVARSHLCQGKGAWSV
jgi:hypothetical protein